MANNHVFIDSSAFIALFNKHDQYHESAVESFVALRESGQLITCDYVLDEIVTFLQVRCGHKAAVDAAYALLHSDMVSMLTISREILEKAFEKLKHCSIAKVSFTDLIICILMEKHKIGSIFTFDSHFARLGYGTVPS